MLNKENERELAFLVRVDAITPMDADRLECAHVGGWHCVVGKNEFKAGDLAVYFEIDSQLPEVEPFTEMEFLKSKNYKIKSQRIRGVVSQGLLMPITAFGWKFEFANFEDDYKGIFDNEGARHIVEDESRFLTKLLGVTYAVPEDNQRKASSTDKYKKMAQRHPNIFRKGWAKWLMRREWGRRLMFLFFGKKKDKKGGWPSYIAAKTDVERIQNMMYILNDKQPFVATEKVDGSSCSIMAERTRWGKIKQYVCSRNVVFETPNDACFYEQNIYFEAYEKYDLKEKIIQIMNDLDLKNVAIQMEVFGPSVQQREYSLSEREARVFHIVSEGTKFPMDKTVEICEKYGIPHVPIIDDNYILPDTIEELQAFVEGAPSMIDGKEKEGIVFYDKKTGQQYFKFVSPEYLLKYHQ